jgi:dCTP diphosphatase
MTPFPNPEDIKDLETLNLLIRQFRKSRGWKVPESPQNTATSIVLEASELLEHFQWCRSDQQAEKIVQENKLEIQREAADVFIYLLEFCDDHGIDIISACKEKITLNTQRFAAKT